MGKEELRIYENKLKVYRTNYYGKPRSRNPYWFAVHIVPEGYIEKRYRQKVLKALYQKELLNLTNKRTQKRNREYNANIKNIKT